MIQPDDRQLQRRVLGEALQGGHSYDVEYRIVRADGEVRFLQVRDETEYDQSGRALRMFGTVRDLTERRRAEALLKENEEKLRQARAELARLARLTIMTEPHILDCP